MADLISRKYYVTIFHPVNMSTGRVLLWNWKFIIPFPRRGRWNHAHRQYLQACFSRSAAMPRNYQSCFRQQARGGVGRFRSLCVPDEQFLSTGRQLLKVWSRDGEFKVLILAVLRELRPEDVSHTLNVPRHTDQPFGFSIVTRFCLQIFYLFLTAGGYIIFVISGSASYHQMQDTLFSQISTWTHITGTPMSLSSYIRSTSLVIMILCLISFVTASVSDPGKLGYSQVSRCLLEFANRVPRDYHGIQRESVGASLRLRRRPVPKGKDMLYMLAQVCAPTTKSVLLRIPRSKHCKLCNHCVWKGANGMEDHDLDSTITACGPTVWDTKTIGLSWRFLRYTLPWLLTGRLSSGCKQSWMKTTSGPVSRVVPLFHICSHFRRSSQQNVSQCILGHYLPGRISALHLPPQYMLSYHLGLIFLWTSCLVFAVVLYIFTGFHLYQVRTFECWKQTNVSRPWQTQLQTKCARDEGGEVSCIFGTVHFAHRLLFHSYSGKIYMMPVATLSLIRSEWIQKLARYCTRCSVLPFGSAAVTSGSNIDPAVTSPHINSSKLRPITLDIINPDTLLPHRTRKSCSLFANMMQLLSHRTPILHSVSGLTLSVPLKSKKCYKAPQNFRRLNEMVVNSSTAEVSVVAFDDASDVCRPYSLAEDVEKDISVLQVLESVVPEVDSLTKAGMHFGCLFSTCLCRFLERRRDRLARHEEYMQDGYHVALANIRRRLRKEECQYPSRRASGDTDDSSGSTPSEIDVQEMQRPSWTRRWSAWLAPNWHPAKKAIRHDASKTRCAISRQGAIREPPRRVHRPPEQLKLEGQPVQRQSTYPVDTPPLPPLQSPQDLLLGPVPSLLKREHVDGGNTVVEAYGGLKHSLNIVFFFQVGTYFLKDRSSRLSSASSSPSNPQGPPAWETSAPVQRFDSRRRRCGCAAAISESSLAAFGTHIFALGGRPGSRGVVAPKSSSRCGSNGQFVFEARLQFWIRQGKAERNLVGYRNRYSRSRRSRYYRSRRPLSHPVFRIRPTGRPASSILGRGSRAIVLGLRSKSCKAGSGVSSDVRLVAWVAYIYFLGRHSSHRKSITATYLYDIIREGKLFLSNPEEVCYFFFIIQAFLKYGMFPEHLFELWGRNKVNDAYVCPEAEKREALSKLEREIAISPPPKLSTIDKHGRAVPDKTAEEKALDWVRQRVAEFRKRVEKLIQLPPPTEHDATAPINIVCPVDPTWRNVYSSRARILRAEKPKVLLVDIYNPAVDEFERYVTRHPDLQKSPDQLDETNNVSSPHTSRPPVDRSERHSLPLEIPGLVARLSGSTSATATPIVTVDRSSFSSLTGGKSGTARKRAVLKRFPSAPAGVFLNKTKVVKRAATRRQPVRLGELLPIKTSHATSPTTMRQRARHSVEYLPSQHYLSLPHLLKLVHRGKHMKMNKTLSKRLSWLEQLCSLEGRRVLHHSLPLPQMLRLKYLKLRVQRSRRLQFFLNSHPLGLARHLPCPLDLVPLHHLRHLRRLQRGNGDYSCTLNNTSRRNTAAGRDAEGRLDGERVLSPLCPTCNERARRGRDSTRFETSGHGTNGHLSHRHQSPIRRLSVSHPRTEEQARGLVSFPRYFGDQVATEVGSSTAGPDGSSSSSSISHALNADVQEALL
eukprot:284816585_6